MRHSILTALLTLAATDDGRKHPRTLPAGRGLPALPSALTNSLIPVHPWQIFTRLPVRRFAHDPMKTGFLILLASIIVFTGCSTLPSQNEPPIRSEVLQESERCIQADAELNRVYNKLLNTYAPDQQEMLRKAERAWMMMRDAEAELAVSRTGGWGRTAGYYSRLTTLTQARIRDLQELSSDE
jgi:uncharacterized protein YecT (DUF1311 family)